MTDDCKDCEKAKEGAIFLSKIRYPYKVECPTCHSLWKYAPKAKKEYPTCADCKKALDCCYCDGPNVKKQ